MPEAPEIFTPEYYRHLAALERTHPWFVGTRKVAEAVIPALLGSPTGGLRILDVGCGTGATVEWLRRFAGRRPVVGIDLAPAAVWLARRSGRIAIATADRLPFVNDRFDLVYCADVVQHLSDIERAAALAEFRRVLRPGGAIVVRSNVATGAPDQAGGGYESFDFRTFPAEIEAAGLVPAQVGRIALLSGFAARLRKQGAGSGWSSRGLQIQPLRGPAALLGPVLVGAFGAEALAFQLRGRLPNDLGASSLFAAIKVVPFERA